MHNFNPGDRLRSIKSGHIYVYVLETMLRPSEIPATHIPVRQELWGPKEHVWMDASKFVKVDSEHYDAAKDKYASGRD